MAAVLAASLLLAGCAQPPTLPAAAGGASPDAVFAPNANLVVQGIPPIPQALVDRVQAYNDFRGHAFVDWHPTQRRMLVAHRKAGDSLTQLYLLDRPMAEPEQITDGAEPVTSARFEPREGRYIVFERSRGGNEAAQLYRMDLATRQPTLLTDPDERHRIVGWLHQGSRLLYSSVPLDRTAPGGRRAEIATTVWLMDPLVPEARRKVAELPGGGWFGGSVSPDDRHLALTRYLSAGESQVWLLDLSSGERRQLLPAAGEPLRAVHFAGEFSPDGRHLGVVSDRAGEFREATRLDLASGRLSRLSADVPWDVVGGAHSRDGRFAVLQFNVDGRDEMRLFDARGDFAPLPLPRLPDGSVGTTNFHPVTAELAFSLDGPLGPGQLYTLEATRGRLEQWTRAQAPPGIDMSRFAAPQVVRWTSFDGLAVSGLLTLPPPRFSGPRPVVVDIHGGPESQAKLGFMGRWNYLVEELGVAVIRPNVRGSSGFGKTFLTLDDGVRREDAVKDIGALLDWIATQPRLDASRVLVSGGSYGGYMSLAASVHFADRIAGAVDTVGISHFVTFLENTESYRRDLRRAEYGDERDPVMREFLHRISPLTQAHRITKPLFVVQGRNDPRVPYTEAEQIVARVRGNGAAVWYLRAENEGHGFARKENADFRFYAFVRFVETVLLK